MARRTCRCVASRLRAGFVFERLTDGFFAAVRYGRSRRRWAPAILRQRFAGEENFVFRRSRSGRLAAAVVTGTALIIVATAVAAIVAAATAMTAAVIVAIAATRIATAIVAVAAL